LRGLEHREQPLGPWAFLDRPARGPGQKAVGRAQQRQQLFRWQRYRREMIERQQSSGQSIVGFCSKEGLAPA
jgi:hypothetical protein